MNKDEMVKICADKLTSIKDDVAAQDRKAAMVQLNISYVTLWRYLKGDVFDVDLGLKMYNFLNKRIEKRKAGFVCMK